MLFFIKSAPCRLAPNEALPHTPLGALPLDPTSPLAPGLSVRFISRFARCFIFTLCLQFTLVCYAHSSFLIPHFSFLISHSSFLTPHSSLKLRSSFSLAPDLFKCNRFMPIALICFLLYNISVNIYSHLAKSRYERTLLL